MKKIICFVTFITLLIISIFVFNFNKSGNGLNKVRVSEVTHSVFYAPLYVAIENGYFEDNGLDIELTLTSGADNVMASLLSSDSDIGLSGSEASIYVYNKGEKDYVKSFAQLTNKDGSFIVSRKKLKNFNINDLKNKTILGGRIGGMPEMTLEYILKENGINSKTDLTIDTSVSFASMSGAFIGGAGDFVTLFEPVASQIENEGYGYKVMQLGSMTSSVPYTAFIARKSYIENNKNLIDKFSNIIDKGLSFVNSHSSDEIASVIMNQFPDTSYNDIKNSVQSYLDNNTWPSSSKFSEKSFNHMEDIMISAGTIDKKVNYKDLVYER